MTPLIRRGRTADLTELCRLEAAFPGDRLSARQLRHHLASPAAILRVAATAGGLAGYALVLRHRRQQSARLYSLLVDPCWRGRGLARALLEAVETAASQLGERAMRLEVRADNAAAIALYRGAGYREVGRRPAYYDDGADALCLRRDDLGH